MFFVSGCLLASTALSNAEPAAQWLMRLNTAAQDLNYRGSFIYRHGDQVEAMQIVRKVDEDGARERLVSLNGASREIIRDKRDVWCYLPDENRGVHQSRKDEPETKFPSILPESIVHLEQFYRFELGADERVAGRMAKRVDIYPKDNFRYGLMLWIDQETGLMLRADMVSDKGRPVEQYMFVEIDYDEDISADELAPSTPRENLVWHGEDGGTLTIPAASSGDEWKAGSLPQGFALSRYLRKPSSVQNMAVHHLVYSDGLATISVFINPTAASAENRVIGDSQMGAINAFGATISDHQVTAIGEVPAASVRRIAQSMTKQ